MSNKRDYVSPARKDDDEFKSEKGLFESPSNTYRPSRLHKQHHAGLTSSLVNNPSASILAYCLASISMTVVNKYVVSGRSWNLNFLYLAIQVLSLGIFSRVLF